MSRSNSIMYEHLCKTLYVYIFRLYACIKGRRDKVCAYAGTLQHDIAAGSLNAEDKNTT